MSHRFCVLLAFVFASIHQYLFAADYQSVGPGVSYAHITEATPWSVHVVKFDYKRPQLHLTTTLAKGTIFGLASVPEQVKALPKSAGTPIAAINGDFFLIEKVPYQGDPRGLQIVNGELVSGPRKGYVAFWMDADGKPHMEQVKDDFTFTVAKSKTIPFGLNETRTVNGATLLTPTLGPTTRTSNGVELVLQADGAVPWLPVHTGEKFSAHVTEIHEGGNTPLRPDSMVLSLGPKLAKRLPTISAGDHVSVNLSVSPNLDSVDTAIGGGPALVVHGKSQHKEQTGKADHLRARNPRTAIGWNDREFFMVVVDGRKPDLSVGMTFSELAGLMIRLGCQDAMNLDGGGSTTMWLNGKVINHPSEKGVLRHVANTLVLVQKP
jgi:exopolysaccharide biosynthesis protein